MIQTMTRGEPGPSWTGSRRRWGLALLLLIAGVGGPVLGGCDLRGSVGKVEGPTRNGDGADDGGSTADGSPAGDAGDAGDGGGGGTVPGATEIAGNIDNIVPVRLSDARPEARFHFVTSGVIDPRAMLFDVFVSPQDPWFRGTPPTTGPEDRPDVVELAVELRAPDDTLYAATWNYLPRTGEFWQPNSPPIELFDTPRGGFLLSVRKVTAGDPIDIHMGVSWFESE